MGYWNGPNATDGNYRFSIGYNLDHTSNERFMVGASTNYAYLDFDGSGAWEITSDRRRKRNIKDDTLGLEFINLLSTKTFQWKPAEEHPEEWKAWFEDPDTGEKKYDDINTDIVMHGLIAQDVEEVFPGLVTSGSYEGAQIMYSGSAENDTITKVTGSEAITKSVKHSIVNTMLIKAVQELTDEVKFLRASITGSTDSVSYTHLTLPTKA